METPAPSTPAPHPLGQPATEQAPAHRPPAGPLTVETARRCHPPLFTGWDRQYVHLQLAGVQPGAPCVLRVDGRAVDFQYTGEIADRGAVVLAELGFDPDTPRELTLDPAGPAETAPTDLTPTPIALDGSVTLGYAPAPVTLNAGANEPGRVPGPFAGFANWPMQSRIACDLSLERVDLARTNDGPLFTDYALTYHFTDHGIYRLRLRCYRHRPWVEVSERFALGMHAKLTWTLNPDGEFDSILSHRGPDFASEKQPVVEAIDAERPADVLCRLQMPVLNEYFVPNNRGWFSFFDSNDEDAGVMGILGLYGDRWREPVANVPEVRVAQGRAEWHASLVSGERHWLLYRAPVEREHTAQRRLTPHRLQAEFNALRLDEHLSLTGEACYDTSSADQPGLLEAGDFHAAAQQRTEKIGALQRGWQAARDNDSTTNEPIVVAFDYLVNPGPRTATALYQRLIDQFERWVHQFKGYREGENDYQKNTLGFARRLRQLLTGYELLRRDNALSEAQFARLNSYFAFAANRVADEARWPTSRTWLHPDHPESLRDLYTYGGEHKPDRLVWTNNLPNFQSDPMCALAHLAALFPEHEQARQWQRLALDDIERQLTAYCGQSGAWEESINYALATLSYFLVTFRVLKHRLGIDYFQDDRVRRYLGWLCRFFGPYDKRFDAYTWPAIGNAHTPTLRSELLLTYAGELDEDDPLRQHCLAVFQKQAEDATVDTRDLCMVAAMAPIPDTQYELPKLTSEHMDELGVSMRHRHTEPDESYLFQKIGFWKDHYEQDETAFNWYAKGAPLCMEYGTYTRDAALGASHNMVEIPDMDPLRRGYLAGHMFSPLLDYTHCEVPVTLKLLWGRVRSFDEIDGNDAGQHREQTPYHYIGDANPVGPKTWKVRKLLYVKPDYMVLFDRVYGDVPHRYNLHVTADELQQDGAHIHATGRFDLDLLAFVQHPAAPVFEQGEFTPTLRNRNDPEHAARHSQSYFRLYNHADGIYRTVLFAKERDREVSIESVGDHGVKVVTSDYTDLVFAHDEWVCEQAPAEGVGFAGRAAWVRREADGTVRASMLDGEVLEAFGTRFAGRGPWTYNVDTPNDFQLKAGPPRRLSVSR